MEPPSPALLGTLRGLRLATPRDLRRAAGRCRRLARDLPAFDCVWLDALVRGGALTPFQADWLAAGRGDDLRAGPDVLRDRLGHGTDAQTFLARPLEGGPPCVVKRLTPPPARRIAIADRLRKLVNDADGHGLVAPSAVREEPASLLIVSRFVPGADARTRLARQGRFLPRVVAEIAQQVLGTLAEARRIGLPHGEIGLSTLRLDPRGGAVLVDWGVRAAVAPTLSIHEPRPPEWYDGIAPERIGTAGPATIAADLYALGCLLWHLLAGRPPFPTGDPLGKLAAHLTRPVPDVTDFAPDTPAALVQVVERLTAFNPEERPDDLAGLIRDLRPAARGGRRLLAAVAAGRPLGEETPFPWAVAAAVIVAAAGAGFWLTEAPTAAPSLATSAVAPERSTSAATLFPLPPPDVAGVVTLSHRGPFEAAALTGRGSLTLRGRPGAGATVLVTDRPLHLWADAVTLEHVRILHRPAAGVSSGVPAAVLVESQSLNVTGCAFETADTAPASGPAGIAWRMIDRADPTAGRLALRDCSFDGLREGVYAADPPRRLEITHTLGVNTGTLAMLRTAGPAGCNVRLANVTLRGGRAAVGRRSAGAIRVVAEDCVFDLPGGGLFAADGAGSELIWDGAGVVVAEGMQPAVPWSDTHDEPAASASSEVRIGGVTVGHIAFAGPTDAGPSASAVRATGGPRRAGSSPGADIARLPGAPIRTAAATR